MIEEQDTDGTAEFGVIRRQGCYVLIAVTPKGCEPERYWLSVGGAEVLQAELSDALTPEHVRPIP